MGGDCRLATLCPFYFALDGLMLAPKKNNGHDV